MLGWCMWMSSLKYFFLFALVSLPTSSSEDANINLAHLSQPIFLTQTVPQQLSDGHTLFRFQDKLCHGLPSWQLVPHGLTFDTVQDYSSDVFGLTWHPKDDKQAQTVISYQVTEFFKLIKSTSLPGRPPCPGFWRGHMSQGWDATGGREDICRVCTASWSLICLSAPQKVQIQSAPNSTAWCLVILVVVSHSSTPLSWQKVMKWIKKISFRVLEAGHRLLRGSSNPRYSLTFRAAWTIASLTTSQMLESSLLSFGGKCCDEFCPIFPLHLINTASEDQTYEAHAEWLLRRSFTVFYSEVMSGNAVPVFRLSIDVA